MCNNIYNDFENIADISVRETIEAFIKYPNGFHGDTGIQHYLYHRVLTNSKDKIEHNYPDSDHSTLMFQSEVYTKLKYRNKGVGSGYGRFDMAFIEIPKYGHTKIFASIAFEVGRNKDIDKMGQFQNSEEDVTRPGDAAKIIRECRFGGLISGYILEFYDMKGLCKAQQVKGGLKSFLEKNEIQNVKVALCVLSSHKPRLWLFPEAWKESININYPDIDDAQDVISSNVTNSFETKRENRSSFADFVKQCNPCNQELQQRLQQNFSKKLRLLYGGNTMTVNLGVGERLLRITNKNDCRGEIIADISSSLSELPIKLKCYQKYGQLSIPFEYDERFISTVLNCIRQKLQA